MTKEQEKKQQEYATKLTTAISRCFSNNEEFEDIHIDIKDFENDENTTIFSHVLLNSVPTLMFNRLTGVDVDILDMHAVAEKLAFQYLERE